jgi:ribosome-binding protein aMBF1 (putative translation factor)
MADRFFVDDVPLARSMSEFPPERYLDEDGNPKPQATKKKRIDERYLTGPIIEKMRKRRGMTGAELSKRIGRAPNFIRTIENKYESCRYETLAKIARECRYKIIIVPEETWKDYEYAYNSWKNGKRSGVR